MGSFTHRHRDSWRLRSLNNDYIYMLSLNFLEEKVMGITSVGPVCTQNNLNALDTTNIAPAEAAKPVQGQTTAQLGVISAKTDLNKLLNLPTRQQTTLSQQVICGKAPDSKDTKSQCTSNLGLTDPEANVTDGKPVVNGPLDDPSYSKEVEIGKSTPSTISISVDGSKNTLDNANEGRPPVPTSGTVKIKTKAGAVETNISATATNKKDVNASISAKVDVVHGTVEVSGSVKSDGTTGLGVKLGKDGLIKINGDNKGGVSADFKLDPNLTLRSSYDGSSREKTVGLYWSN